MPDPHLNVSIPQGSPQVPSLVFNREQRLNAGVGILGTDDYNNASMQMYNNAYNYWLWQQQMAYNSPKAQVERLKEAGLNPNFNSIEGTGNAGSIPTAGGGYQSTYGQKHLQAITTGVNIATGLASSVAKGVQALKGISTIPLGESGGIRAYRRLLFSIMGNKLQQSGLDVALKNLEAFSTRRLMGIDDMQEGYQDEFGRTFKVDSDAPHWLKAYGEANGIRLRNIYQDLQNQISQFNLDHIKPAELKVLQARIPYMMTQLQFLLKGVGLRDKELKWKDWKEAVGLIRGFIPGIGLLLK